MWMITEGELTVTVVEAWLLDPLSSVKLRLAVSVWLPKELPVVFHVNVWVVLWPAARSGTLWTPIVTLSVTSRSVSSMLPLTGWLPALRIVTTTFTLAPWVTEAGALTLVIARSVTGVGGGEVPPSTETPKYCSTRSMRLAIVCVELPANSSATGFLASSSVTISDPESPPPLNVPGSMTSWSMNRADLRQNPKKTS